MLSKRLEQVASMVTKGKTKRIRVNINSKS